MEQRPAPDEKADCTLIGVAEGSRPCRRGACDSATGFGGTPEDQQVAATLSGDPSLRSRSRRCPGGKRAESSQ